MRTTRPDGSDRVSWTRPCARRTLIIPGDGGLTRAPALLASYRTIRHSRRADRDHDELWGALAPLPLTSSRQKFRSKPMGLARPPIGAAHTNKRRHVPEGPDRASIFKDYRGNRRRHGFLPRIETVPRNTERLQQRRRCGPAADTRSRKKRCRTIGQSSNADENLCADTNSGCSRGITSLKRCTPISHSGPGC